MSEFLTNRRTPWLAGLGVAVVGAGAISAWLIATSAAVVTVREPGQAPKTEREDVAANPNPGTLVPGDGTPSERRGNWSRFRGDDGTNIAPAANLARLLAPGGTKPLWSVEVCEGYAGPAVRNGRVYLVDYDRERKEDVIRCLSLDDGREIWRYTYFVRIKMNHGITRTVPAVNDRYVVALGPLCHVHCLDAATGRLVWRIDLVRECGTKVPAWYAGQCPLIDGDVAVLAPGGEPLMMAVDLATGKPKWRTPNPGDWGMTHSSIVRMDYAGVPQYVYCHTRGVVGVAADDGRMLWNWDGWRIAIANVPTPLPIGDGRIFFSGGYDSGAQMIRLTGPADAIRVEKLYDLKTEVFGAEQQTPILYGGCIYGVIPPRAQSRLVCLGLDGKQVWATEPGAEFGLGSYMLAAGTLLVFEEATGMLRLYKADPAAAVEVGRVQALVGHEIWAPPAIAAGRLLIRNNTHLICLDVS